MVDKMTIKNNKLKRELFGLVLVASAVIALTACGKKDAENDVDHSPVAAKEPSVESKPAEIWPRPESPFEEDVALDELVDNIFLQMSIEEKVGQVIQAEIQSITPEQAKKYHIGSILNGGGSMPYRISNAKQSDWLKMADAFYEASMDKSDGNNAIPIIWGTDAVHGHGNVTGATVFPHNIGLGAANNPELIRQIAEINAREVRATGIEWVFGPTIAVSQNDKWGRGYESYSENPEIVAAYSKAMVLGMQGVPGSEGFLDEKHVLATAKHFLGDGGTEGGDDQGDVKVDERALAEIHGAGYFTALEAGVQSVMASFNSWHGEKVHGNRYLMTEVLKGKLGFEGFVVGDWNGHGQIPGCTNGSCAASIEAGLDMYMVPNDWEALYHNLLEQIKNGEVGIGRLNDAVKRIIRVKLRLGLFNAPKPSERFYAKEKDVLGNAAHRAVARQAVRESLVLLKNKNGLLPLSPSMNILVAGSAADDIGKQSGGWTITWQGVTKENESFPDGTSIYDGINASVQAGGGTAQLSVDGEYKIKPDVAVVVFGENPYAEGMGDVNTIEYQPGSKTDLALLKKLKEEGIPVVSVFISGRPLWVNPELNASDAFVAAWLPGSEGIGVADVLMADSKGNVVNDFKGRLSFSWPKLPTQSVLDSRDENYDPLFAYGSGLTYASGEEGPGTLPEDVEGVAPPQEGDIDFYVGKPIEPWRAFILSKNRRQFLSGGYSVVPEGDVQVRTMDKDLQEDALKFTFEDAELAMLTFEEGAALDLSEIADSGGVLSFELMNIRQPDAKTDLLMICGQDCERSLDVSNLIASLAGKGWQNVQIELECFAKNSQDFKTVQQPFVIRSAGSGELGVANVRFLKDAPEGLTCPN